MAVMALHDDTEFDFLPSGWTVVPLGELIQSVEYGSSAKSKTKGSVPVLRMGNLQDGSIEWDDLVYTDDPEEIRKYTLRHGDVLFNRTNTVDLVGKTAIYDGGPPAIFAGYLIRVVTHSDLLDPWYLNYVMNTELARRHSAKVLSVAVGQANINAQKLCTYPIPLPPSLEEQRNIAGVLRDTDNLLSGLTQTIEKKEDMRRAMARQLLTGQTRLPGFDGKWTVATIAELADVDPEQLPSSTSPSFEFKYVSLEDVDKGTLNGWSEETFKTSPSRARRVLRSQDVIAATVRPNLKSHYWFKGAPGNWVCSTGFAVIRCKASASEPGFIFYQLFSDHVAKQIDALIAGSNYPAITSDDVRNLQIPCPKLAEQSAIASVLADVDAELRAVRAQRTKVKDLKTSLMQQLLSGRTRLTAAGGRDA